MGVTEGSKPLLERTPSPCGQVPPTPPSAFRARDGTQAA